jgi:hypothetical protein
MSYVHREPPSPSALPFSSDSWSALYSGALATGSAYGFFARPSLRSTGLLAAGLGGASIYYLGAKGTALGMEDGPKLGVRESSSHRLGSSLARSFEPDRCGRSAVALRSIAVASALALSVTFPSALQTLRPIPLALSAGAAVAGLYYAVEALADNV